MEHGGGVKLDNFNVYVCIDIMRIYVYGECFNRDANNNMFNGDQGVDLKFTEEFPSIFLSSMSSCHVHKIFF